MNDDALTQVFFRQLRFWSIHSMVNALPSLAIALFWLGLWKSGQAVAAMFAAIFSFILIYSLLSTFLRPLSDERHLLHHAMRLGTKIRVWISVVSLVLVPMGYLVMFTPDYWCGWLSVNALNIVSRRLGSGDDFFNAGLGQGTTTDFGKVYVTTMLEGFILSGFLFLVCFFALVGLQIVVRNRPIPRRWLFGEEKR